MQQFACYYNEVRFNQTLNAHWAAASFMKLTLRFIGTGACVEGGATLAGDRCTLTPLQVSSASASSVEIVPLLLAHGANGFLSTQHTDSMCFAQRGCYSAISVAAAHDQRATLRKLLSHPLAPISREVLSLEEMLAEGDGSTRNGVDRPNEVPSTLSKTQIKCLQEAMYHSAENNHLGKNFLAIQSHSVKFMNILLLRRRYYD